MDLSLKERDRISVLRQVKEGVLSAAAGAARIGVTRRHFRRLRRKFEAEGDAAVVHGLRGRRSNRALPRAFRERALEVAREPLYRDFGPTLLAEHLERSFALRVSSDTLRSWMMEAGLWKRQRRRAKHRSRRPRRAALGELEQWDSSVHAWLEDRAAGDQVLISIHDDATSRLMMARFVERDDGAENRRAIIGYLQRHGRPLAVYTGPRRTLRAVAGEEGGADRYDHLTSAGRVGGRGDTGGLSPGEGTSRADLRYGAGPPDQGDAGGRDLHP